MGKIYGYARVSTPTQRLDRQIKNIEEYCKDKKIKKIAHTGKKSIDNLIQSVLDAITVFQDEETL